MTTDVDLDPAGDLILATDDGPVAVRASRSFPWSAPDRFVVLRDAEGEERATIDDLSKLPARSRGAVEAWLQRHTLIPKVLRVLEVRPANAAWRLRFDTDRGEAVVTLREREDLRSLPDGRVLVRDPDGRVFELPPPDDLDARSQDELSKLV